MEPEVTAEAVRFRVPDAGYREVRLHQSVERPHLPVAGILSLIHI